jgi:Raf kinase inhibitor-like YbhB/YbcL family protein
MHPVIERMIGRTLVNIRAGDRHLAWNSPALSNVPESIVLTSPSFEANAAIPRRHAAADIGGNISPALAWSGVPAAAAELILVMQDRDAPLPRPIVHVLATGIPADWAGLPEGILSRSTDGEVRLGRGSFDRRGYAGPRPVRGHGMHHYVFQLVAVDQPLPLSGPPGLATLLASIAGHAMARGRLIGTFERL